MEIILIIICGFLGLALIFAAAWVINRNSAIKSGEDKYNSLHNDGLELKDIIIEQTNIINHNEQKRQELQERTDLLQSQLTQSLSNNANAEEALRSRYNTLTTNIEAAQSQLTQLTAEVQSKTSELANVTSEVTTVAAEFKEWHDKVTETMAQNAAAMKELEAHNNELVAVSKQLENVKLTYRAATLEGSQNKENWFDFTISDKEQRLSTIIGEISSMYPELSKDLAGILWKKVGLPKVQDLSNREGLAIRGIYRLVLKSDEKVCYIGQAVSIKDRGYEHMKKMLGVDVKGSEKVYQYTPGDFYWTVLERNTEDLNSAEHYGIDYYCCKEIGLNKRI